MARGTGLLSPSQPCQRDLDKKERCEHRGETRQRPRDPPLAHCHHSDSELRELPGQKREHTAVSPADSPEHRSCRRKRKRAGADGEGEHGSPYHPSPQGLPNGRPPASHHDASAGTSQKTHRFDQTRVYGRWFSGSTDPGMPRNPPPSRGCRRCCTALLHGLRRRIRRRFHGDQSVPRSHQSQSRG